MSTKQPEKSSEETLLPSDDVEALCEQFSQNSTSSDTRIVEWLENVPEVSRRPFFRKLLEIELTRRCEAGETPAPDEYHRRFPEFSADVDIEFERLTISRFADSQTISLDRTISLRGSDGSTKEDSARQPGERVGRYQLERRVGGGGFGVVWQAFDPELNRRVAIKLARSDRIYSESVLRQTREEARKAAAVTHNGIVPVYDVVPCEGSLGIVSEFISGQTLSDRMQSGRVPLGDAIAIVIQVAQALHHAHKHGLVHRDVKPGNILLRPSGDAVLTDFGLAVYEVELLREPGGTVGTRFYMSPEQARGESNRVDARSDVFSLGVVLYQLVTGRLPWVATTSREYVEQLAHRPPRPPRTIDDAIDPELERICLRCLEKSVGSRFATCDELARDLSAFQDKLATVQPPSKTARWLPVAALVLVGAAVATALFWPDPDSAGGNPRTDNSTKSLPPAKSNQPDKAGPKADPFAWRSLLVVPPTIVSWPRGVGRGKPQFDAEARRYSVRSERMRWIARTGETSGEPFEIRAVVHVEKWIGQGGIVWGLRNDPDAFPKKQRRCLCVEFLRTDEGADALLVVREMFLSEFDFDDWRVNETKTLAEQEIKTPENTDVPLRILVKKDGILVNWGDKMGWAPDPGPRKVDWLPAGKTAVGITGGFGRKTRLTDLSFRYHR